MNILVLKHTQTHIYSLNTCTIILPALYHLNAVIQNLCIVLSTWHVFASIFIIRLIQTLYQMANELLISQYNIT